MVAATLRIVTGPLTLFLEMESARSDALQVPLPRDALLVTGPSIVDFMSALVLLDKVYGAGSGVVAEDFELADLVVTLALDLAALDLEFLDPHLLTVSILLVPAFPNAHFYIL